MKHSIYFKLARAIFEIPFSVRKAKSPHIIMTLLVKDEEELLALNLEFHHAMGIEHFIITDNNSTDRTPEIIRHYQEKGWVLRYIEEHSTDYEQKTWVDRMIEIAKEEYHADWIINADADEFWYPSCKSFPALLSNTHATVYEGQIYCVYPEENKPWQEWTQLARPVENLDTYKLSPYSLFANQKNKVLHRASGYIQISMGNHKVTMLPYFKKKSGLTIFHFNIRGREQFIKKMVNGGQQLEQHQGRHGGRHWRYFYKLYKQGLLSAEYERVIGTQMLDVLKKDGYLFEDRRLRDFLREIQTGNR